MTPHLPFCTRIAEIFGTYRKSGSRNSMVASDFTPEMEICPFRACAMKNVPYKPYLRPNRLNLRVVWKIGVEDLDGDVRYYTGNEM